MRQRSNSSHDDSDAEDSTVIAPPHGTVALPSTTPGGGDFHGVLAQLQRGQAWWVQVLTIFVAASLTYSYNNVGKSTNVQIAIMTVVVVVGASPFAATHLTTAALGTFVGGQNIIASTGVIANDTVIVARNYFWLLLLSAVVGFVWCCVINSQRNILDGYAGRLGTTTFIGMNLVMVTIYGPAGVCDWDRYYYGVVHLIHVAEDVFVQ